MEKEALESLSDMDVVQKVMERILKTQAEFGEAEIEAERLSKGSIQKLST